ncbi:hypothetical protein LPJ70_007320, partial [Coemansia sp. RSA 2708]
MQPPANPRTSSDRASQPPTGLPAMPQRVALKDSDTSVFRSTAEGSTVAENKQPAAPPSALRKSDSSRSAQSSLDGQVLLTQRERDRALAHSEWENARMEELGTEIRKLLGAEAAPQSQPETPNTQPPPGDNAGSHGGSGEQRGCIDSRPAKSPAAPLDANGKAPPKPDADSVLSGLDLSQPLNLYK